jgi:hypothetical protein
MVFVFHDYSPKKEGPFALLPSLSYIYTFSKTTLSILITSWNKSFEDKTNWNKDLRSFQNPLFLYLGGNYIYTLSPDTPPVYIFEAGFPVFPVEFAVSVDAKSTPLSSDPPTITPSKETESPWFTQLLRISDEGNPIVCTLEPIHHHALSVD